ncbi:MAG: c-type cytochrome [Cyanobacteria bacterium REEB67]|nr:c-type cytochrome [Cyanobacteria bacterium REEB67]
MRKAIRSLGLAALMFGLLPQSQARESARKADGKLVFEQNCASCHQGGGNSINRDRPLAGSAKLQTMTQFKKYLNAPKGHMPFNPHVISDRKALDALYKYCKDLPKVTVKQASL